MIFDFFGSIQSYLKAITVISRMRLGIYFLIPSLISLVLAILIFSAAIGFSDDAGQWIADFLPFRNWKSTAGTIATWFSGFFIFAIGLLIYKHAVIIFSAPFMSLLSEKVERYMAGDHFNDIPFSINKALLDLFRGLRLSLRLLFRELLLVGIFLVLSLIPVVGTLSPFLVFLIQAYFAGFSNMDFTLERHYSVRQSVEFVRKNKGIAIGNGALFLLLLLTGIGFLFALPLATVAATIDTYKRLEEGV